jgi:hypothetical protein
MTHPATQPAGLSERPVLLPADALTFTVPGGAWADFKAVAPAMPPQALRSYLLSHMPLGQKPEAWLAYHGFEERRTKR